MNGGHKLLKMCKILICCQWPSCWKMSLNFKSLALITSKNVVTALTMTGGWMIWERCINTGYMENIGYSRWPVLTVDKFRDWLGVAKHVQRLYSQWSQGMRIHREGCLCTWKGIVAPFISSFTSTSFASQDNIELEPSIVFFISAPPYPQTACISPKSISDLNNNTGKQNFPPFLIIPL